MRRIASLTILLGALACPAVAQADDAIIVQRAPGLDRAERADVRSDAGVQLVETLSIPDTEVVTPRDDDVRDALAQLNADPAVLYAERDLPVRRWRTTRSSSSARRAWTGPSGPRCAATRT